MAGSKPMLLLRNFCESRCTGFYERATWCRVDIMTALNSPDTTNQDQRTSRGKSRLWCQLMLLASGPKTCLNTLQRLQPMSNHYERTASAWEEIPLHTSRWQWSVFVIQNGKPEELGLWLYTNRKKWRPKSCLTWCFNAIHNFSPVISWDAKVSIRYTFQKLVVVPCLSILNQNKFHVGPGWLGLV